jgi:hypothetical protein
VPCGGVADSSCHRTVTELDLISSLRDRPAGLVRLVVSPLAPMTVRAPSYAGYASVSGQVID